LYGNGLANTFGYIMGHDYYPGDINSDHRSIMKNFEVLLAGYLMSSYGLFWLEK